MKKIILSVWICTSLFVGGLEAASNITEATVHSEKIILGSGCFWGAEKGYESLPGVIDAVSGYADGKGVRASYSEITKFKNKFNVNNHAEVVEVTYNKNLISTEELLIHYFESHDPTQLNRQGNDIGTQYRSIILYSTQEQKQAIDKIMQNYQRLLSAAGYGPIVTAVKPIKNFYKAEKYHQDYIAKNPNGYCPDHSTGVRFTKKKTLETLDNSTLLSGKHIIVIEAEGYCPYCEKFRDQVVENYFGNIPLVFRLASQLQDLEIKSPTWATPTILFIEDGEEVFGHQGYLSPKEFYQALGYFKLGDSEAYRVAFQQGTDARFCKEYEIFKNTMQEYYI
jgi:peptide methionine sulfoxide reductase msrA/msrB